MYVGGCMKMQMLVDSQLWRISAMVKCFAINGVDLYLDIVLVEYQDIPIFFICKGKDQYYVILCADIDDMSYVIIKPDLSDVLNMLNGELEIRKLFVKQQKYWEIISGETFEMDEIRYLNIENLDITILPEDNVYYSALTDEVKNYIAKFEEDIFRYDKFSKWDMPDTMELTADLDSVEEVHGIEEYTEYKQCNTSSVFSFVRLTEENYKQREEEFSIIKNSVYNELCYKEILIPDAA